MSSMHKWHSVKCAFAFFGDLGPNAKIAKKHLSNVHNQHQMKRCM